MLKQNKTKNKGRGVGSFKRTNNKNLCEGDCESCFELVWPVVARDRTPGVWGGWVPEASLRGQDGGKCSCFPPASPL